MEAPPLVRQISTISTHLAMHEQAVAMGQQHEQQQQQPAPAQFNGFLDRHHRTSSMSSLSSLSSIGSAPESVVSSSSASVLAPAFVQQQHGTMFQANDGFNFSALSMGQQGGDLREMRHRSASSASSLAGSPVASRSRTSSYSEHGEAVHQSPFQTGVDKRTTSTRQARVESVPYPTTGKQNAVVGSWTMSGSPETMLSASFPDDKEITDMLAGAGIMSHEESGSSTSPSDPGDPWDSLDDRRSSVGSSVSASWNAYSSEGANVADPPQFETAYLFPTAQGDQPFPSPSPSDFLPPAGHGEMQMQQSVMPSQHHHQYPTSAPSQHMMPGSSAQLAEVPRETRKLLEGLANQSKSAMTTSGQDRARATFVQTWLKHSYTRASEGNVSRHGLYGSYVRACARYGIRAINSASFGKAVRQAFPSIKTRRLGVRGASRYHYCGMKPAHAAEAQLLAQVDREEALAAENSGSATGGSGYEEGEGWSPEPGDEDYKPAMDDGEASYGLRKRPAPPARKRKTSFTHEPSPDSGSSLSEGHMSSPNSGTGGRLRRNTASRLSIHVPHGLGKLDEEKTLNGGMSTAIPERAGGIIGFPAIDDLLASVPELQPSAGMARTLWGHFAEHCRTLLGLARQYRFDQFEGTIKAWWASLSDAQVQILQHHKVAQLVYRADAVLYDEVLGSLHAQVLVNMPPQAFQSVRLLADSMENIILAALGSFVDNGFTGPRIELAARFGHLLVRHLGLCQLAQALVGVLAAPETVTAMVEAWDGLDFDAVRNQSALVSNCNQDLLSETIDGFRLIFNDSPVTAVMFTRWIEEMSERYLALSRHSGEALNPRSILLRWSFTSSQIMRDLTLRSSPAFGSFQIVALFLEEYLAFQVLRRVILQAGSVAASVEDAERTCIPRDLGSNTTPRTHRGLPPPQPHVLLHPQPELPPPANQPMNVPPPADYTFTGMGDPLSPNTMQMFASVVSSMGPPTTDFSDSYGSAFAPLDLSAIGVNTDFYQVASTNPPIDFDMLNSFPVSAAPSVASSSSLHSKSSSMDFSAFPVDPPAFHAAPQ